MGLYASIEPEVLNLPATTGYGVVPDYSWGCSVFVYTFLEEAKTFVPVRTGNLQSSLQGMSYGDFAEVYTDCPYAAYVEYGTWRMEAQPYFEPAVESGLEAAEIYWKGEVDACLNMSMTLAQANGQETMDECYRQGKQLENEWRAIGDEIYAELMAQADALEAEIELAMGTNIDVDRSMEVVYQLRQQAEQERATHYAIGLDGRLELEALGRIGYSVIVMAQMAHEDECRNEMSSTITIPMYIT